MENFTREIRRDILKNPPQKRCCRLALLSAFLDTSGSYGYSALGVPALSFTSEHEDVAEYLLETVEGLFGVRMTVTEAVKDPKHGMDKLTFSYSGRAAKDIVDTLMRADPATLTDCCAVSYLKGAFLGGGSCTLPQTGTKTGYHLEFIVRGEREAEDFLELLDRVQLIAGCVPRGEKYLVYLKSRESISDLLGVFEARTSLATFEALSAAREESNRENRTINCLAGNADRAATASVKQVVALRALQESGVLETLPEPLREVALARLENPACSLGELAASLGISKSCINHRLRKLIQIASEKHA